MTRDERAALDSVADRLAELHQMIGRLEHENDLDVATILDETLALTQEVERISDRVSRDVGD